MYLSYTQIYIWFAICSVFKYIFGFIEGMNHDQPQADFTIKDYILIHWFT